MRLRCTQLEGQAANLSSHAAYPRVIAPTLRPSEGQGIAIVRGGSDTQGQRHRLRAHRRRVLKSHGRPLFPRKAPNTNRFLLKSSAQKPHNLGVFFGGLCFGVGSVCLLCLSFVCLLACWGSGLCRTAGRCGAGCWRVRSWKIPPKIVGNF